MFEIKLQVNNSEKNRVTKTLVDVLSVSGTLREDTSIIDPVIMIECNLTQVVNVNYMTITAFNRSYFVNNIRSIRNGLVEFSCHVDVLSTYATQIKANTVITRRQQYNWNTYLNDGTFRVYQDPIVFTKPFPAGFTTQNFVLAVAGS